MQQATEPRRAEGLEVTLMLVRVSTITTVGMHTLYEHWARADIQTKYLWKFASLSSTDDAKTVVRKAFIYLPTKHWSSSAITDRRSGERVTLSIVVTACLVN